jgi:hypothetical protein
VNDDDATDAGSAVQYTFGTDQPSAAATSTAAIVTRCAWM